MYADDQNDRIIVNDPNVGPGSQSWILGYMQDNNPDSTNKTLIEKGSLFAYNKSTAIYRCPSDLGRSMIGGKKYLRVRSCSINGYMNGVDVGLSASIVTRDFKKAMLYTERIEAGVVKVNQISTGLALQAPFGGVKKSSSDSFKEQGASAIEFYTKVKTVYLDYSV